MWDFSFLPASWHHSNTAATHKEPSNETGPKVKGMRWHSFKTWGGMEQAWVAHGSSLPYFQSETLTSTSRVAPLTLQPYCMHASPLSRHNCTLPFVCPEIPKWKYQFRSAMAPHPPANMLILGVPAGGKGRQEWMVWTSLNNVLIPKLLRELKPAQKCQYTLLDWVFFLKQIIICIIQWKYLTDMKVSLNLQYFVFVLKWR